MNATGDGKAPIHRAARRFISWSHEILKLGKQFYNFSIPLEIDVRFSGTAVG